MKRDPRSAFTILAVVMCVSAASAQRGGGGGGRGGGGGHHSPPPPSMPSRPSHQPAPPPTTPAVTLPMGPAALSVPMPLGPPPGTIDLYQNPSQFHSNQPSQLYFPGGGYVPGYDVGPYPPGSYPNAPFDPYTPYNAYAPGAGATAQRAAPRGSLRFETQPTTAQVFVDGFYVGVVDDFGLNGRPLDLPPGSHHVELRARDYAPASFEVNIIGNQISRYRGDLQMVTPIAPSAAANVAMRKYYVIPNCYAGTRPPAQPLPSGCQLAQMKVMESR